MYSASGRKVIMHKRKSVLVSSLALHPSKLCISFHLFLLFLLFPAFFLLFFCSFSLLLFLSLFNSPYLSLCIPFCLLFLPCLCSYSLIISFTLVPVLIYLCVFPFILPLSLLMPSMLSGFVFPLLTSIYSYSCLYVPVVVI